MEHLKHEAPREEVHGFDSYVYARFALLAQDVALQHSHAKTTWASRLAPHLAALYCITAALCQPEEH